MASHHRACVHRSLAQFRHGRGRPLRLDRDPQACLLATEIPRRLIAGSWPDCWSWTAMLPRPCCGLISMTSARGNSSDPPSESHSSRPPNLRDCDLPAGLYHHSWHLPLATSSACPVEATSQEHPSVCLHEQTMCHQARLRNCTRRDNSIQSHPLWPRSRQSSEQPHRRSLNLLLDLPTGPTPSVDVQRPLQRSWCALRSIAGGLL
mmetsp:Transcript_7227/g.12933  ORF Transcript_7227/g.12933 Transcript_7227/m.12933 type:complete len:206 (-) Transcript_7227:542-1159(-)